MSNTLFRAAAAALVCATVAGGVRLAVAADTPPAPSTEPKLVNEKVLLKRGDSQFAPRSYSPGCARLRPDGKALLYAGESTFKEPGVDGGPPRDVPVCKLVLRDLEHGSDFPLPIAPFRHDVFVRTALQLSPFDPTGTRIALGAGLPTEDGAPMPRLRNPAHPDGEMRVVLYDLLTQETRQTRTAWRFALATFDRTGKNLIVMLSEELEDDDYELHATPVDKLELKKLGTTGFPLSPCPTADVIPIASLPLKRTKTGDGLRLFLYDVPADREVAELPVTDRRGRLLKQPPQWTTDGRYLYYKDELKGGKAITRVWDRETKQPAGILEGMTPVGPGPTATTMVLDDHGKGPVLHDARTWYAARLADSNVRLVSARGRTILYTRFPPDDKGAALYAADIVIPDLLAKPAAADGPGIERALRMTPEQQAKTRAWLAENAKGAPPNPAKFADFLLGILDPRQQKVLNKIVTSSSTFPSTADGLRECDKILDEE